MSKFTLDWKQYAALARQAAAEGCVLLENKNNTLPLAEGETCAVFGRTQFEYYKSGTGSGGLVNTSYVHDLDYALTESSLIIDEEVKTAYKNWLKDHPFDLGSGWAQEPWCQVEMPLSDELVSGAASRCQTALIVIGRTAGEDRDNAAEKGSWYLTDGEEAMLEIVCRHFSRTVVILNVGNIIDMSFVDRYEPSSVLYIWQGGMEGGSGAVDVITGKVPASGRLSDTIAYHIDDYPSTRNFGCEDTIRYEEDIYVGYRYFETFAKEKVRYPFGYGLSYTTFDVQAALDMCSLPAGLAKGEFSKTDTLQVTYDITNTGDVAGKETIQFYVQKPQGFLGKPSRELIRFAKTELLEPGEGESGILAIDFYALSSYDDSGITGHAFCYVLEEGTYTILAGTDVRNAKEIGSFALTETVKLYPTEYQIELIRNTMSEYISTVNNIVSDYTNKDNGNIESVKEIKNIKSISKLTTADVKAKLPSALCNQCIRDAKSIVKKYDKACKEVEKAKKNKKNQKSKKNKNSKNVKEVEEIKEVKKLKVVNSI